MSLAATQAASGREAILLRRILARDAAAAAELMTANNQRLFRAAWSILKNRAEAEDAVQDAYLKAFAAIAGFKGDSSLSTWLTRIVINEALGRRRKDEARRRALERQGVALIDTYREALMQGSDTAETAEQGLMRAELAGVLERAIQALPDSFRLVFVLREIEGLSVAETAAACAIPEATVKTRLLRARRALQAGLQPELDAVKAQTLTFLGADCQRMTARVLDRLGFG